jgi:hypothetical protein
MDNREVLAAMKRRRLGLQHAAMVEAQASQQPMLSPWQKRNNALKQRKLQVAAATAKRAEQQNQYVASLLAKVPPPAPPKIRRGKPPPIVEFSEWDDFDPGL